MAIGFEFIYGGTSIEEFIGECPNLNIRVNIKIINRDDRSHSAFITRLEFKVDLFSADSLNGHFNEIGTLGKFPVLPLYITDDINTIISIPLNTKKFKEMQKIRTSEKLVCFVISAEGHYLQYDSSKKQYGIPSQITGDVIKIKHDSTKSKQIILTTEEFIDISKEFRYFEIYRLEIPISKIETSAQKDLHNALKLLKNAKDKLIQYKYEAALLDIRNAISNHIFEKVNEQNKLKNEIEDHLLSKVPVDVKDVYKEILKNITKTLNSLLQNLHKFIHKDSNKLKLAPMPQDIEMIYFTTVHIIKYLISYG